ncbi:MAG TPA: N-acetyltransferase [Terriglobales bacterium]|nr:N-acetyltransferase [Terriglobales bacterium]
MREFGQVSPRGYNSPMKFHLRESRGEDFDTLWKIDQLCFPPGIAYSRLELKVYMKRRSSFTLVAEADSGGEVLGFLVAEAGRRRSGHIITIDVLPQARRFGIGSQLLRQAESRLADTDCDTVLLETAVDNAPAIAFYKRHGYFLIKTISRYYSNGVNALVLQKDLVVPA